ncbi:MAG TPA: CHAT domain-containing protein, partial [bacterium]|nr:CHAT domain-containing protein [bacterium]
AIPIFLGLKDTLYYAWSLVTEAHYSLIANRFHFVLRNLENVLNLCNATPKLKSIYYDALFRTGAFYLKIGNFDQSIKTLKKAENYFESTYDRFTLSAVLFNMGAAYKETGDYKLSETCLRRVLTLAAGIKQPNDRAKAAYSMLSDLYLSIGKLDQAIAMEYLAIKELKTEKAEADILFCDLGNLFLRLKDFQKGEDAFLKGLSYLATNWNLHSGLAYIAEIRGNIAQADSFHSRAITLANQHIKYTQGTATSAILKKSIPTFNQAARFYWRIGKPEKAFELLETGRARYLSQLLNLANVKSDKSAFTDSIRNIEKQIGELYRKPESGLSTHQLQIFALEAAREQLLDSIKKYSPQFYAFKKTKIPTLKELQTSLGSEFQLIEYAVMDDSIFALTVNSEKVSGHVMQIRRDSLERMIDRVITAKQSSLHDLQQLYWLLITPMEKNLQTGKPLIIIPDDALFRLPFEMLVKNHDGNYRSAKYLLHDFPVSYAVSASVWLDRLGRHSRAPKNYAGFAAAVFDTLSALPFVKNQVDDAADRFSNSTSWTDAADLRRLFVNRAGKYKIIDMATHAFVSDIEPMRSKIVFNEHGGEMNAFEIYELDLDADLAVLSACGTGLGKLSAGEGFMGFNQAFSYAGVYSLIMSAWDIDDESTAMIMKSFYEGIASGLTRAEALRRAKLKYINEAYELKQSPYYWAGLMLWGNPEAIPLHRVPYGFIAFLFIPFAIIIVSPFVGRLRKKKKH